MIFLCCRVIFDPRASERANNWVKSCVSSLLTLPVSFDTWRDKLTAHDFNWTGRLVLKLHWPNDTERNYAKLAAFKSVFFFQGIDFEESLLNLLFCATSPGNFTLLISFPQFYIRNIISLLLPLDHLWQFEGFLTWKPPLLWIHLGISQRKVPPKKNCPTRRSGS